MLTNQQLVNYLDSAGSPGSFLLTRLPYGSHGYCFFFSVGRARGKAVAVRSMYETYCKMNMVLMQSRRKKECLENTTNKQQKQNKTKQSKTKQTNKQTNPKENTKKNKQAQQRHSFPKPLETFETLKPTKPIRKRLPLHLLIVGVQAT